VIVSVIIGWIPFKYPAIFSLSDLFADNINIQGILLFLENESFFFFFFHFENSKGVRLQQKSKKKCHNHSDLITQVKVPREWFLSNRNQPEEGHLRLDLHMLDLLVIEPFHR